jgi:hypothetical protein
MKEKTKSVKKVKSSVSIKKENKSSISDKLTTFALAFGSLKSVKVKKDKLVVDKYYRGNKNNIAEEITKKQFEESLKKNIKPLPTTSGKKVYAVTLIANKGVTFLVREEDDAIVLFNSREAAEAVISRPEVLSNLRKNFTSYVIEELTSL